MKEPPIVTVHGMTGFAETGHSWSANTGPTMTADGPVADWQV
jgi:hypothetical protein